MLKSAKNSAQRDNFKDQWIMEAINTYDNMEKKLGIGYPKLFCDIRRYRDVRNC
jgi:hypothetical protein